jgi:pimeloyl-ACP methyl ester carboxylesterase
VTLIFIHGAGAGSVAWRLQLVHFRDAHAIPLPGHPKGSGRDTIEGFADSVRDYVRANQLKNPVLVGHSMGGAIAIEYALRGTALTGLVLVGTGARLRLRQDLSSKLLENYREGSRMLAELSVAPDCDPVIIDRLASELLKVRPEVTLGDLSACNKFDRMSEVHRIICPTLIMCGAKDQLIPVNYSEYLHQEIKNSRLVVIPGVGHSVMLENHRDFNRALEDFVCSVEHGHF